jgi:hypothetical protein
MDFLFPHPAGIGQLLSSMRFSISPADGDRASVIGTVFKQAELLTNPAVRAVLGCPGVWSGEAEHGLQRLVVLFLAFFW